MPAIAPDLAKRLDALTGDSACCALEMQSLANAVAKSDAYATALRRAKALADERRLLALALLKRRGELCACEIQAALRLTHATVSHHMGVLADASLVAAERRGKWVHYRLAPGAAELAP